MKKNPRRKKELVNKKLEKLKKSKESKMQFTTKGFVDNYCGLMNPDPIKREQSNQYLLHLSVKSGEKAK